MIQFLRNLFYFFVLLVCLVCGYAYYEYHQTITYTNPKDVTVRIPKGSSVRRIAFLLAENGVIDNDIKFELYLRAFKLSRNLKAGEYEFSAGMSLDEVIDKMRRGDVKLYKFTIPEGYNIKDVCRMFAEKKIMQLNDCDTLVRDTVLLRKIIKDESLQDVSTLEGFLFPETYLYEFEATPEDIFTEILTLFKDKVVASDRVTKAKAMGFDLLELVTFASIVEKETGLASERPQIAAVFHSRLKIGMLLQTDPTVIYGIPNYDGNIRKRDLTTDTPYNTYTRPGLPIGPIANPGLAAIDAVLNPEPVDYLYFVAKGDGSHYFSKTLDEHNAAVQQYQLRRNNPQ